MKPLETVDYSILPNINDPSDIRSLNVAELNTLAQEIRNLIIHTVASTGAPRFTARFILSERYYY